MVAEDVDEPAASRRGRTDLDGGGGGGADTTVGSSVVLNGGTNMRASIFSATLKVQGCLSHCLRLLCFFQPACSSKNGLRCSGQIQGH